MPSEVETLKARIEKLESDKLELLDYVCEICKMGWIQGQKCDCDNCGFISFWDDMEHVWSK